MASLKSVLLLLALAPGAATIIKSDPDEGASPPQKGGRCPGYKTGPGMEQKNWRLDAGDDCGCQGISIPCPDIELQCLERDTKYVGNCNQEEGPPGDPKGCLPIEPWCIDMCKADNKKWNVATHESNDDDLGCWCSRAQHLPPYKPSDDEVDDDEFYYSCPYKQYKNRLPPTNGCPQDAFDYGPDGGCGCYDDDLWHMTDGDEEVTCDNITYEQCKMKSDEYWRVTGKYACASACMSNKSEWTYKDDPTKTCAHVAKDPKTRCNKMGNDGQLASKACKTACGCPMAKGFVMQFWGLDEETREATVTVKSFAAKMREAENTVAVRVPTLVAVCVMAGVALGGLVTTFAPTKKIEETTPLVAAKA
jgi:hypothetical protein